MITVTLQVYGYPTFSFWDNIASFRPFLVAGSGVLYLLRIFRWSMD